MQRIAASAVLPALLIFVLYALKALEVGMGWDFAHWGVYPKEVRGLAGIVLHPLAHDGWQHLAANTLPLFFLSWCLFYFYRGIAPAILACVWVGCGVLTFCIGRPAWHVGASGLIYGLAFFLFFSGLLRRHVPLVALSLLVTFIYGSLVWNMFPEFARAGTSWEGHLAGAVSGTLCAFAFKSRGPQRPEPFADEEKAPDEDANPPDESDVPPADSGYIGSKQAIHRLLTDDRPPANGSRIVG